MILIFFISTLISFNYLYAALWKQCTETKDSLFICGLLRIYTSIQRSKTGVYVLTLRSLRN
jgi:hypothetical protein